MSELASGWTEVPLAKVADVLDRFRVPVSATERASRQGNVPYYGATGRAGWIDEHLFDEELVLLGEDGAPFLERDKLKAYIVDGPAWVNNHAHILRGRDGICDNRYLLHYLNHFDYHGYANGTTRLKLTQREMNRIPVLLAPLSEQRRIVAAIEEQFSRLDAGLESLARARARLESVTKSVLLTAIPDKLPDIWILSTVGEAGEVNLGRQRSPKFHSGPNMRSYLRVANVFENRIDTTDVMSMQFSDSEFERYKLRYGDVLLNEGQSPHLLGRPAMYRGDPPDVTFTNSLLRFRARPRVLPEWALLVFRRHLHAKRFMQDSQITTNIAHLSAGRFKAIEFPVPPVQDQERILREVDERLIGIKRVQSLAVAQSERANALRRSVLKAAFSGKLTVQASNQESASVSCERVAAEHESSVPSGRFSVAGCSLHE